MEQINAQVDCDITRLNAPLRPFYARVAHSFVALFRRVPADTTGVFVRLFKADGSYFDVTAHEHADGTWLARIGAACFPAELDGKYEVHAYAADDQPTAIGEGRLVVQPFSATAAVGTVPDGTVQQVAELPTSSGSTVQVVMVYANGAWQMQVID
jgi:hypothetical protein